MNAYHFNNEYDGQIRAAAMRYLPQWDWRWLKCELHAESGLDLCTTAESESGAQGIAQFMPATWSGEVIANGIAPEDSSAFDPEYAIPAAAWYLAKLRSQWTAPRSEGDRRRLTQASYNAGIGNILHAQQLAKGANDYLPIIAQLPHVTGLRAAETTAYVTRIERYFAMLVGSAT